MLRHMVSNILRNKYFRSATNVRSFMVKTLGKPFPYPKPFPYKKKRYNILAKIFDKTIWRMNSNSKVIVIEGNIASGKTELGESLAHDFDLKYFPQPTCDDIFAADPTFDLRQLNKWLPRRIRHCDFEMFYTEEDPKSCMIGLTQMLMLKARTYRYAEAMLHLLSTGQGVVVERSPHTDVIFANVLHKNGFLSDRALEYYDSKYREITRFFLPPHLIIYLDAPLSVVRDGIKRRNDPAEMNTKVLTDEYLESFNHFADTLFLPNIEHLCELLRVDLSHGLYPAEVAEEVERFDFENQKQTVSTKLQLWLAATEHDLSYFRHMCQPSVTLDHVAMIPEMLECPELIFTDEDIAVYTDVVREHPRVVYETGREQNFVPIWKQSFK